jgi:hypothetical protein
MLVLLEIMNKATVPDANKFNLDAVLWKLSM